MTSRCLYDKKGDPYKCALGVHYEQQVAALNDVMHIFETARFADMEKERLKEQKALQKEKEREEKQKKLGRRARQRKRKQKVEEVKRIGDLKKFQKGGVITIKSNIELQKVMEKEYGVPYLMCGHTNQDYHESHFGDIRVNLERGNRNPSALQLIHREGRWVCAEILKDSDFDLLALKPELQKALETEPQKDLVYNEVIEEMSLNQNEDEAMHWVASTLARKLQKRNWFVGLGSKKDESNSEQAESVYTDLINHGQIDCIKSFTFKFFKNEKLCADL